MSCLGCRAEVTDSKVKVEENGKKAVFLNSGRESMFRTKVDGCLKINETSADFVVSKVGAGDVIVELKGKDVDHAAEQIAATAEFMKCCSSLRGPVAGLIVCLQYPRVDTKFQRIASAFAKKYKGPIHVVTRNEEFLLEKVISFKGPR